MDFSEIKEIAEISGNELLEKSKSIEKIGDLKEIDKPIAKNVDFTNIGFGTIDNNIHGNRVDGVERKDFISRCPIEGNGGHWEGERGNSTWFPDRNEVPKIYNPDGLTWGQILDKYGIDGIPFKDGEPDFSDISKDDVEIDDFSENRYGKGGNFDQATEKLAEQRGCTKEEVKEWMKENNYTWHEKSDCKTMQKVPSEVHTNIPHEGGISQVKKHQNA